MIAIIDYEIGNIGSVLKAFQYLNIPVTLTSNPQVIKRARALVLPGVGAFGVGKGNLDRLMLTELIIKEVASGKPLLGICLGQQLLFESSAEDEGIKGLGLIKGRVTRFLPARVGKVPHIGWNQVEQVKDDPLFSGIENNYFYFVHSYYVAPETKDAILARTSYGRTTFASVVRKDNIWGIQCHPEKSSKTGLKFLKNFGEVVYGGGNTSN